MQATIHNEFLTLTVDTHGAEAVSLKNAAGEEMLWQADPSIWKRHAPICVEPACAYSVPLLRAAEGRRVHPQRRVL